MTTVFSIGHVGSKGFIAEKMCAPFDLYLVLLLTATSGSSSPGSSGPGQIGCLEVYIIDISVLTSLAEVHIS